MRFTVLKSSAPQAIHKGLTYEYSARFPPRRKRWRGFFHSLFSGPLDGAVFLSERRDAGLHQRGARLPRSLRRFPCAGRGDRRRSRDSLAAHDKFRTKEALPFPLVSDPDEVLCHAFDVIKEKKNYGKTYMGIERSTFLLNPQGAVVREWRKVKVAGHVAEVLQALQEV